MRLDLREVARESPLRRIVRFASIESQRHPADSKNEVESVFDNRQPFLIPFDGTRDGVAAAIESAHTKNPSVVADGRIVPEYRFVAGVSNQLSNDAQAVVRECRVEIRRFAHGR